jgi:hypothetical protein
MWFGEAALSGRMPIPLSNMAKTLAALLLGAKLKDSLLGLSRVYRWIPDCIEKA